MPDFTDWGNFYVIVGSAAGALIGLQFVVMTLIAERPSLRAPDAAAAFATPSVVHFAGVLLLSAAASAPWHRMIAIVILWGLVGIGGLAYVLVTARRMRRQTAYQPVFEDWLFHVVLPLAAYAMLATASGMAPLQTRPAWFIAGGAVLILLFVGIHNAWDAVTYHVFTRRREPDDPERNGK